MVAGRDESEQDPRVKKGICGVTQIGTTGIEWICVKKPHAKVYTRRASDRTHKRGDMKFDTSPGVDKHYFVNRWPNRQKEN